MYVLWFSVFIVFLVMFHYYNCVVLLLLFVVWFLVSIFRVHAAAPGGTEIVVLRCVVYVMRTNRCSACVTIRRSAGPQNPCC